MNWNYIKDRFSESSTWRGLIAILTAFGVMLSPDQVEAIIAAGLFLAGAIGVGTADKN
jgi:hypothetical protein